MECTNRVGFKMMLFQVADKLNRDICRFQPHLQETGEQLTTKLPLIDLDHGV